MAVDVLPSPAWALVIMIAGCSMSASRMPRLDRRTRNASSWISGPPPGRPPFWPGPDTGALRGTAGRLAPGTLMPRRPFSTSDRASHRVGGRRRGWRQAHVVAIATVGDDSEHRQAQAALGLGRRLHREVEVLEEEDHAHRGEEAEHAGQHHVAG